MFVNILTADDKYSLLNRDNLRQPIQMQSLKNKSLKSPFSDNPSRSNKLRGPNTVEILTTPPLIYLLITVKATELEKISLGEMESHSNVL